MSACRQEMCPMWDGDTCPCATFGLDPDNLPRSGTFTVTSAFYYDDTNGADDE